jgi:5-deoxy-glucuronate isomerase
VYGSGPGREIDVTAEVRSGDVIVMPHGYHGPSMAAPGYDLYYLNVMAGPVREWKVKNDPDHEWLLS